MLTCVVLALMGCCIVRPNLLCVAGSTMCKQFNVEHWKVHSRVEKQGQEDASSSSAHS